MKMSSFDWRTQIFENNYQFSATRVKTQKCGFFRHGFFQFYFFFFNMSSDTSPNFITPCRGNSGLYVCILNFFLSWSFDTVGSGSYGDHLCPAVVSRVYRDYCIISVSMTTNTSTKLIIPCRESSGLYACIYNFFYRGLLIL